MKNIEIREKAKHSGVYLWKIAQAYGTSDSNFSRKLRQELPDNEKEKIIQIIETLTAEKEEQ